MERHNLRNLCNPGIAGDAIEGVEQGASLELPGKHVLAAASTYQQHVQCGKAPLQQADSLARGEREQNGTREFRWLKATETKRRLILSNTASRSLPSHSSAP